MKLNGIPEKATIQKQLRKFLENYQIPLILVSMGKQGSRAYYKNQMVEVPAILQKIQSRQQVREIPLIACVLDYILKHGLENLSEQNFKRNAYFCKRSSVDCHNQKRGTLCDAIKGRRRRNFEKIRNEGAI